VKSRSINHKQFNQTDDVNQLSKSIPNLKGINSHIFHPDEALMGPA